MFAARSDTSPWSSLWQHVPEIVQFQEAASRYTPAPALLISLSKFSVPASISAPWLGAVQRRIETSVAASDDPSDPAAITEPIAMAAIAFFEATSDVLPGEPFLYPTGKGDVVAEFVTARGQLTGIVGSKRLLLHAVIDGSAVQHEANIGDDFNLIRQQLRGLSLQLQARDHGTALGSKTERTSQR